MLIKNNKNKLKNIFSFNFNFVYTLPTLGIFFFFYSKLYFIPWVSSSNIFLACDFFIGEVCQEVAYLAINKENYYCNFNRKTKIHIYNFFIYNVLLMNSTNQHWLTKYLFHQCFYSVHLTYLYTYRSAMKEFRIFKSWLFW